MPLDFFYELKTDSYRLDLYDTEEKLIAKMRTGRGDPERYSGRDFIYLDAFLGQTDPSPAVPPESLPSADMQAQDFNKIGLNEIVSAKAVSYSYIIALSRNPDIGEDSYSGWED